MALSWIVIGGTAELARQSGPSFRSRQLAMELRKLRLAAGLTQEQVAHAVVGMSKSKVGKQERAKIGIYPKDLHKLLDLYRVTDQRRVELLDAAWHSQDRGAFYVYGGKKLPEDWQTWIDFESEASTIYNYEPLVIPGLLQTPEYASAIIKATGLNLTEAEIHGLVSSRMARQTLLSRANPVKLHSIIEESALFCRFDDARVWVRQLQHLLDAANKPNVTIQIMPSTIGFHPGFNGPFVVLNYDHEPSLVWLENKISSLFLDENEQIEVYTQTWTELCALAYNVEKSVDFISAITVQVDRKS